MHSIDYTTYEMYILIDNTGVLRGVFDSKALADGIQATRYPESTIYRVVEKNTTFEMWAYHSDKKYAPDQLETHHVSGEAYIKAQRVDDARERLKTLEESLEEAKEALSEYMEEFADFVGSNELI